MQVHLLVEQQGSQVDKVHFGLLLRLQPEGILVPPDDLVVLLFLLGRQLFENLQEGFVLEILLLYLLNLLLYLQGFALVWEALGVLLEELEFLCASLLQLFQHFLFHFDAGLWVDWLLNLLGLHCSLRPFVGLLLFVLPILEFFPFLLFFLIA